ncbi:MAG: hypothetical protein COA44_02230 [Arcobacter sp.]|nr:MAG: hypothetical protein COA44_02230 [Arcobacter sp.]
MQSDELDSFIVNNRKRKSVFDEFRNEIFRMIEGDVSQLNIIKYVKSKVKKKTRGLTQPNLSEWLKRQKNKKQLPQPSPQEKVSSGNSTNNSSNEIESELDYSDFEEISELYDNMNRLKEQKNKTS